MVQEEIKEKEQQDEDSKVLMPFDIKKMIEYDMTDQHSILDGISFPISENFEEILQWMKEISLQAIKKIQNSIQRIKGTDKRLKELERKAKENYTKKSKFPNKFDWVIIGGFMRKFIIKRTHGHIKNFIRSIERYWSS